MRKNLKHYSGNKQGEEQIVCMLYNKSFNQIVTADSKTIYKWDPTTGTLNHKFLVVSITTLVFFLKTTTTTKKLIMIYIYIYFV